MKKTRKHILRNLLIYAVNEAVLRKEIDLNSIEPTKGEFDFVLFEKPSRFKYKTIIPENSGELNAYQAIYNLTEAGIVLT